MTRRLRFHGAAMLWAIGVYSLCGYTLLPAAEAAIAHRAPGHLVLVLGVLFILYLGACVLILRRAVKTRRALLAALALAALFRFTLLPTPPVLSGDAYRYVWDARLLEHHLSPYLYAPADARVRFLRDRAIYPHTGWHGVPTLYPPGAQYLFAVTYRLAPDNVMAIKAMLLALEALTVAAAAMLLRARGQDPARVLLYAWNPLAVLEIAGNGHVDAAAAAAIMLALLMEQRRRPVLAGMLLGLAALCKLFPLVGVAALPRRDWPRAAAAALATVGAGYLPFILAGARPAGYLGRYVTDQDFNQWLYEPAHWVASAGARHLLHTLPLVALLPVLGAIAWQRRRGALHTVPAMVALLMAVLLFSPSMFPWYLLTVLPLLALVLELREERPALRVSWWPRAWLGPAPYLALVLLSGTVVWSYAFGLGLRLHWVGVVEYLPSYLLLAAALRPALGGFNGGRWWRVAPRTSGGFLATTSPRRAPGGARDGGRRLAGGAERIRTSVFGLRRRSPG